MVLAEMVENEAEALKMMPGQEQRENLCENKGKSRREEEKNPPTSLWGYL